MDYRSDEAKYINSLFMQSKLANIYETAWDEQRCVGFRNRDNDAMYMRTNFGRFVRVDGPPDDRQYNVLSADKQRFEPMAGAFRGREAIDRRRVMTRSDMVPPPGRYEYLRDSIMPRVGYAAGAILIAQGLNPVFHWFAHHAVAGMGGAAAVVGGAAASLQQADAQEAHTAPDEHVQDAQKHHNAHVFDNHHAQEHADTTHASHSQSTPSTPDMAGDDMNHTHWETHARGIDLKIADNKIVKPCADEGLR